MAEARAEMRKVLLKTGWQPVSRLMQNATITQTADDWERVIYEEPYDAATTPRTMSPRRR
ncbi:MAG: hypothetical protein QE570_19690 [Verrucomicrobiota bacterium]|nr:hypothetical protein [Verrucomicrobiota bacterium]